MRTALVIGGTGLVGSELVSRLAGNSLYGKVIVLSRRPLESEDKKVEIRLIDFDKPDPDLLIADDVFCAIGTTLRKAGSKEQQYKIDCEYPAELGRLAKVKGAKRFILVSSIGADPRSSNFYLRIKGDLEAKLGALSYDRLIILRPSLILGSRNESRPGERVGIFVASLLKPLLSGPLKKYRGVKASAIAACMVRLAASEAPEKVTIISSENIC